MSKQQVFCMVGGTGETSYANNSIMQRKIIEKVKPLLEESIGEVCCNTSQEYFLNIADLGCSSGLNALAVLRSIIDVVVSTAQHSGFRIPELNVFLNDLPRNDFNTIFKSLASFYREIEENYGVGSIGCFISGTPGSFYGRLFPCNLVHFMHSSTCLHWLSQAPKALMGVDGKKTLNEGCIYGRKGSPTEVLKAYRQQFANDFAMFLRCRSKEIIHGGRILLSFLITQDDESCPLMELTSIALYQLASQGRIDKEKLDGFNLPFYRPTIDQVKQLIESEESLSLDKLETFTLSWVQTMRAEQVGSGTHKDVHESNMATATSITKSIRAMSESLLAGEFGEEIMDDVFRLVQGMVVHNIDTSQDMEILNLVVSLIRKSE